MLAEIFLIVVLSSSTRCSKVIDAKSQKGIYLSEYCPKMKYCPEGAHVMCMYYNPNSVMGPQCRKFQNVSINSDLANKLLDVSNAVRSKIARGVEKGKDGELLPKGYGIFRLRWDSELATFAQVLANQCVLRRDLCRATKKFPNPGQTAGLVRFSVPDWIPVSKARNFTRSGLNNEKLMYATTQTLKTWYGQKSTVTSPMVTSYPNWIKHQSNQNGRLYLEMIYGSATHMGCGISAYTEYAYFNNGSPLIYNSVQIICNFSGRPHHGMAVYNTVPPTDTESRFNVCGCPAGTMEDDDCLCLEVTREADPPVMVVPKSQACPSGDCDPTVVLLPIFTIEDAPPEKLVNHERFPNISMARKKYEMDNIGVIDSFEELFDNKGTLRQTRKPFDLPSRSNASDQSRRSSSQSNGETITKRHMDTPNVARENKKQSLNTKVHEPIKKPSIFINTPIFELPENENFIKKYVVPRKDFSAGKQLVNEFLNSQDQLNHNNEHQYAQLSHENILGEIKSETKQDHKVNADPHIHPLKNHHEHSHDILTTEPNLNAAEQIINNRNKTIDDFNLSQVIENSDNILATKNDKKFMDLLDTLEQEVKHIELREKEKQIFDAKIKKIYGKVTGKTSNALVEKKKHQMSEEQNKDYDEVRKLDPTYDALDDTSNLIDEVNYRKHEIERVVADANLENFDRPLIKNRNSRVAYDRREKYDNRRSRNLRQNNRNQMGSYEYARYRYDNGFKGRRRAHRNNKRYKNYYGNSGYDDPLSIERRKYYQDKLDSMERKLRDVHQYNSGKNGGRSLHMRAIRPSFRSENQMNPLYTGRARILHGY